MFFDSHCHLQDPKFAPDRADAFARFRSAGVSRVLTLGTTIPSCRAALDISAQHPDVFAAVGIHPSHAAEWTDAETPAQLQALLAHPRAFVLGEIGLDHYWDKDPAVLDHQRHVFRAQLRIAKRLGKAVSIHSRECTPEVLRILREEDGPAIGGVMHCFAGTLADARETIDLGFHIGVGGSATYPNAAALRDVLRAVGPGRIVLETDAPYLPPQPRRGKRNEPAFLPLTAAIVADTFGLSPSALAERTTANAFAALKIDPAA